MVPALALLFAVAWLQYGLVTATYEDVPADVAQIRVYEWKDEGLPMAVDAAIARRGAGVAITAAARSSAVVVFARKENEYLVDGPIAWTRDETRTLADRTWRRSIRGLLPSGTNDGKVEWVGAGSAVGPWPRCFRNAGSWECWGLGASDHGVLALFSAGRLWWASVGALLPDAWRSAAWGRKIVVHDSDPPASSVRITFAHPVTPSPSRIAGIRLGTSPVPHTAVVLLEPGTLWAFGEEIPPRAWMEVQSAAGGPVYVPLHEVATGGVGVPLDLRLPDTRPVKGNITGVGGERAAKALVTMFRIIDPPPPPGLSSPPRRVFAAETTADENGEFSFEGRGEAAYEIVAWHPQFGRASVLLDDSRDRVDIKLEAPGLVRGRVVSRRRPLAGVAVVSVPDAESVTQVRDVTEIKGGDAKTGQDGRFAVALSAAGGGELRIGGGGYAVRRVPLPRSLTSAIDIGDVELEDPLELFVTIDGDPGCTLQMIGPVGKMGLQVVEGVRDPRGYRVGVPEPGLWQFGLSCAAGRRLLQPDSIQITRAMAGTTVQFTVR